MAPLSHLTVLHSSVGWLSGAIKSAAFYLTDSQLITTHMSDAQNQVQEPIENLDASAIQAEEQILQGASEAEIRAQVIDKHGLDELEHPELIDSLVADKLEEQKRLSTAIKQKRKWREKATKPPEDPKPTPAKEVDPYPSTQHSL